MNYNIKREVQFEKVADIIILVGSIISSVFIAISLNLSIFYLISNLFRLVLIWSGYLLYLRDKSNLRNYIFYLAVGSISNLVTLFGYLIMAIIKYQLVNLDNLEVNYQAILDFAPKLIYVGFVTILLRIVMVTTIFIHLLPIWYIIGLVVLILSYKIGYQQKNKTWIIVGMVTGFLFNFLSGIGFLIIFLNEYNYLNFER